MGCMSQYLWNKRFPNIEIFKKLWCRYIITMDNLILKNHFGCYLNNIGYFGFDVLLWGGTWKRFEGDWLNGSDFVESFRDLFFGIRCSHGSETTHGSRAALTGSIVTALMIELYKEGVGVDSIFQNILQTLETWENFNLWTISPCQQTVPSLAPDPRFQQYRIQKSTHLHLPHQVRVKDLLDFSTNSCSLPVSLMRKSLLSMLFSFFYFSLWHFCST